MTVLIGIAGASGSGKTTLAQALARELSATLIREDDYYLCATQIPGFDEKAHNFDALAAKDMARLAADLAALKAGRTVEKPLYDFTTHTRCETTEIVHPAPAIIVEGILALADPRVHDLYDLAIWLDTPEDICVARRVERDMAERGRERDAILAQLEHTVLPSFRANAPAQRARADLVLEQHAMNFDLAAMIAIVREHLTL